MPVLINWKICDNAQECSGIEVCPVGAISWDDVKKKIEVNNEVCINCGVCIDSCPVNAIKLALDDKEYKEIQKEIDNDTRKVSDLFVDRYGAEPIHPAFLITKDAFEKEVLQSNKIVVVEVFVEDSIKCLLQSIPIKVLLKGSDDIKFRKIENKESFFDKYDIENYPALLFFKDGKLKGKIESFYEVEKKDELIEKIKRILC